jgi:tetratricopeptide (TPR) repeat protein
MAVEHDELFAKYAVQLKLITSAQLQACRDALRKSGAAGKSPLLASVAVAQKVLLRDQAQRLIDAINKKFPGKHPPLPEKASVPVKPAAKKNKLFLLLGGAAAVIIIAVIVILALSSKKPPPRQETFHEALGKPVIAAPKIQPKTAPKPEPEPPPSSPLPPPPKSDPKAEFDARRAEKKKLAQGRLEEVKREIAQERKEATEATEVLKKRLAGKPVTITLGTGEIHKDAVIRATTLHDVEFEAGSGISRTLLWDALQPSSVTTVADAIFDPAKAKDQFDRGRLFIARRSWKEAQEAFERAAKLGEGYESRVLEFSEVLERVISGRGFFRAVVRQIGRDGLRLTWDLQDPRQIEDFSPGLVATGRAAVLETKKEVVLVGGSSENSQEPILFSGELSVEMKLSSDEAVFFTLFSVYRLEAGPKGAALFRLDEKDQRKEIARSDKVKLSPGKIHDLRIQARYPRFVLLLDGQEMLVAEDPPKSQGVEKPAGAFAFAIDKGRLRIEAPFSVQGTVPPAEIEKRLGDVEVRLRRALDPDLDEIERRRHRRLAMSLLGEGENTSLSADDLYFLSRIKDYQDVILYEELKDDLGGSATTTATEWASKIDGLITRYPDGPSFYYLRALWRHDRQDPMGARADLAKALDLFPDFSEALLLQGRMFLEENEAAQALAVINRAIELQPDFVEAYVLKGMASYTAAPGSIDAILPDLATARKLDPYDSQAIAYERILKYQTRGPRDLGCRFDHETAHYRVTTDISVAAAKSYGENLEAAFRHYGSFFKDGPRGAINRKPRVAIFNTPENYYTYYELLSEERGENTGGVFRPGLNELVLFERTDLEDTHQTLYHEAFHHFMTLLTSRRMPYWYNEGMAEYMGAIRVKEGKVIAKSYLLKDRLRAIQWTITVGAEMAFRKIMLETPREFYSGAVGLKYAQAWSMIHFFHEFENGKHRPLIEGYFAALKAGRTPEQAYEGCFAPTGAALETEWKEFVKKLKP